MKKKYIAPQIKVYEMEPVALLSESGYRNYTPTGYNPEGNNF